MAHAIPTNQASLFNQVYNHPNWQVNPSSQDIDRLLRVENKQFVITASPCGPQESQKSVRFVIYFLNDQRTIKEGHITLDPEKPGKWLHVNQHNVRTRDIGKVFQHVADFRNCPQYAEAKF